MFSSLYRRRAESLRSLVPSLTRFSSSFPFYPWSNKSLTCSHESESDEANRKSFLQVDVIVVGGGLSGLAAAKLLHDIGIDVLILEAKNRVGGRTLSKKNSKTGIFVDLGGSYVGPTQNHIRKLATDLEVERFEIDDFLPWIYCTNGSKYTFNKFQLPRFWNPLVNLDFQNMFYRLDKMSEEIPLDNPWLAPHANEWDQMSMRCFANKYVWTKAARHYLEKIIVGRLTSSKPQEVSMLWFLWLIKQGYKSDFIFTASQAKYVILAIPLNLLTKIHFRPPLPIKLNQLVERVFTGTVIKCVVFYENAFWRDKGLSGAVLDSDEKHPFSQILDDSNPDNSNPALSGLIIGDNALKFLSYTQSLRQEAICKSLEEIFESAEALTPLNYEEKLWSEEQYTGGSYSAVYPPGGLTTYGSVLRQNCGRIYFAGTETALRWTGFMDGAVSSGERAAKEVLAHMGKLPLEDVWRDTLEEKNFQCDNVHYQKKPTQLNIICMKFLKFIARFISLWIFYRFGVKTLVRLLSSESEVAIPGAVASASADGSVLTDL
uniref:Amine oxidase n=1 Tax=Strigamia maritima TaxID=126957 RepID=T1IWI1_STRMM